MSHNLYAQNIRYTEVSILVFSILLTRSNAKSYRCSFVWSSHGELYGAAAPFGVPHQDTSLRVGGFGGQPFKQSKYQNTKTKRFLTVPVPVYDEWLQKRELFQPQSKQSIKVFFIKNNNYALSTAYSCVTWYGTGMIHTYEVFLMPSFSIK